MNNSHFNHLVADIHYVQPFSKTTKLEVGYNLEYNVTAMILMIII
jgi:hypothetical protein